MELLCIKPTKSWNSYAQNPPSRGTIYKDKWLNYHKYTMVKTDEQNKRGGKFDQKERKKGHH